MNLVGGAHARGDEAGQQSGRHGQARALGNIVDLADDLESAAGRAGQAGEHVAERLGRALETGRHDSRGDYCGLQEAQVVACEIEDFGDRSDFDTGFQVDADQAEHRLIDDAQVRFDGRLGLGRPPVAAHAEIHRNIQHAGAFREVHPEKENVAPSAVRQVHAHGRGLAENRKYRRRGPGRQQLGTNPQRIVGRVPGTEHPLVAAHRTHAAAHLVGQRLEAQGAIAGGQRARKRAVRAVGGLRGEEDIDGFLEAAFQQIGVALERNQRLRARRLPGRKVETVQRVKEKEGTHPFVEVFPLAPEPVERFAFAQQFLESGSAAERFERLIAGFRIAGRDGADEAAHRSLPAAAAFISRSASSSSEIRKHLAAILPVQGQGQLRGQQAVAGADIVPPSGIFERQVLLVAGQLGQGRGKSRRIFGRVSEHTPQDADHRGSQHVNAEVAKIMAGP